MFSERNAFLEALDTEESGLRRNGFWFTSIQDFWEKKSVLISAKDFERTFVAMHSKARRIKGV